MIGALLLAIAVSGYYIRIDSIGPLYVGCGSGWWYKRDDTREVITEADAATQTTVPIRPGQRQGFFIQVFNFTAMTQTVLGSNLGGFDPNGGTGAHVGLSTTEPQLHGSEPHAVTYALPVSIPPGQSRFLRITWTSTRSRDVCSVTGLPVRLAVTYSDRTEALVRGEVLVPRADLTVRVTTTDRLFRDVWINQDIDAAEMSLATYCIQVSRG